MKNTTGLLILLALLAPFALVRETFCVSRTPSGIHVWGRDRDGRLGAFRWNGAYCLGAWRKAAIWRADYAIGLDPVRGEVIYQTPATTTTIPLYREDKDQ